MTPPAAPPPLPDAPPGGGWADDKTVMIWRGGGAENKTVKILDVEAGAPLPGL